MGGHPLTYRSARMIAPDPDDDPRAWLQALVRRFELPLLQYAGRIVGCPERARDVVQDTFLRLQERGPDQDALAEGNAAARWLFTVCRHRALDVCRKEHRVTYLDQEMAEAIPHSQPGPAETLVRKEAAGFLRRLLEELPARQQEVIQLKFQNNLSYQEISQITRLSVSNVGFLIHRGLKALREQHAKLASEYLEPARRLVPAARPGPTTP